MADLGIAREADGCNQLDMRISILFCLAATTLMACEAKITSEAISEQKLMLMPGREPLSEEWLDKIENTIKNMPCVGSLNHYERRYMYKSWNEGTVSSIDIGKIEFEFREAGKYDFRSGRKFYIDQPIPLIDDRSYKVVYGQADLMTNSIEIKSCGLNFHG